MFRILIVAAFALAACAPKADTLPIPEPVAPLATTQKNMAIPAPTPAGVTQRLTAGDNGKTITVPVGTQFAVELVGVPTAGYVWAVVDKPAFLSDAVETSGNTTKAQSQPGFVGGNHWEVFSFTATAAGEGALKLEQRRPWEKNEPASQTFAVTIKAQ